MKEEKEVDFPLKMKREEQMARTMQGFKS